MKRGLDPRLRLSVVIISLQILGQTALGFKVSIAQILVSIGICLVMDLGMIFWRTRTLVWPASAMLTGNSVAFILRASGTQHGDWWSLNGIQYFALAAVLSMLAKYLIRLDRRHVFNPSNFGLVAVFLLVGSPAVFPQYLWWGAIGAPVIAALVVIAVGALWVLRPVRMVPMAAAFLLPFTALVGLFAVLGRCFAASWAAAPVCGTDYWLNISLSPELLIFVFFMMSDPRTAPDGRWAKIVYGAATALIGAALIHLEPAEYGIKVALLAGLTIVCSGVVLARRFRSHGRGVLRPAAVAAALVALAAPAGVVVLANNRAVLLIEQNGGVIPGTNKRQ